MEKILTKKKNTKLLEMLKSQLNFSENKELLNSETDGEKTNNNNINQLSQNFLQHNFEGLNVINRLKDLDD